MKNLKTEYAKKKAWGLVASIDVYDCDKNIIKDPKAIESFIIKLCEKIKMKRHGKALIERFAEGKLEGYSAMQFIETSSVTMHFDEVKNRAFVDIFSCKYFDPKMAEEFSLKFLGGSKAKTRHFLRV